MPGLSMPGLSRVLIKITRWDYLFFTPFFGSFLWFIFLVLGFSRVYCFQVCLGLAGQAGAVIEDQWNRLLFFLWYESTEFFS